MSQEFTEEYIDMLARKWKDGTISDSEKQAFEAWYNSHSDELLELPQGYAPNPIAIRDRMHAGIKVAISAPGKKPVFFSLKWVSVSVAASLLLISGIALYLFKAREHPLPVPQTVVINDAPAGINKATLTLSDGRIISLSDAQSGMLATDASAEISVEEKGQVVYANPNGNKGEDIFTNTMQTPKGGQFRLVLPDGTRVRLNAASSLKYATRFTGKTRTVELTGEAYFEVAHNKAMPFVVKTASQQVKVLGTHFNVNSYTDEGRTVTTLEEGSVQIQSGKTSRVIRPGQQTILSAKGTLSIQQADMQTALAWKNNEMVFKDAGVKEVMRQIARWYDLEIVYDGPIPDDTITASIDRQSSLSTVLKIFGTIQIHFILVETPQGKQLIIKP